MLEVLSLLGCFIYLEMYLFLGMAFFFYSFLVKKMGVVDGSTDSVFDPTSSDRIRNIFTKIVTTFDHVIAMGRPAR